MAMPQQQPGNSRQDYSTPANFIRAVKSRLRISEFDFDFAADETNYKATSWWGSEENSLIQPDWHHRLDGGGWGWLNPPFANIEPWAAKCAEASIMGGARIALLVPASVGSNWFRDYVNSAAKVLFLNGRLAFIPDRPKSLYPKDCILALYGPELRGCEVWDWRKSL